MVYHRRFLPDGITSLSLRSPFCWPCNGVVGVSIWFADNTEILALLSLVEIALASTAFKGVVAPEQIVELLLLALLPAVVLLLLLFLLLPLICLYHIYVSNNLHFYGIGNPLLHFYIYILLDQMSHCMLIKK